MNSTVVTLRLWRSLICAEYQRRRNDAFLLLLLLALVPFPGYWLAAPLPTWWTLLGYIRLAEGQSIGWLWMIVGMAWLLAISTYLAIRLSRRSD
ncbi:MAG: hypothetical protein LAT65_00595 [Saccharospirillum sp.]|nr:hypothetical protein [Saccharospirillum sp.]